MSINLETHSVESTTATEIYISATPGENAPLQEQLRDIFSGISQVLRSKKANIFQERVFATQGTFEAITKILSEIYGDIADGVAPSFLVCKEGASGLIAGVQVHAVCSNAKAQVLHIDSIPSGRILSLPGRKYLALSGICAPEPARPTEQACSMLEKAEAVIKQAGGNFLLVPRTWMWLKDILCWYDDFNKVRNKFFTERGIIGKGSRQSMPASTGIGLGPANGGHCAMDLTAVIEPAESIEYLQATGKQQCAFEYGSAFSRASRAITPAGETVYISGTASIDTSGVTTNAGDAIGQINTTIENVRAVLRDMNCVDEDVVQVMAYCKTPEVEKAFNKVKGNLAWPWITMICDVCRDDLLFEVEAAAMPRN